MNASNPVCPKCGKESGPLLCLNAHPGPDDVVQCGSCWMNRAFLEGRRISEARRTLEIKPDEDLASAVREVQQDLERAREALTVSWNELIELHARLKRPEASRALVAIARAMPETKAEAGGIVVLDSLGGSGSESDSEGGTQDPLVEAERRGYEQALTSIGEEAVRLVETWDTKHPESILQIKAWGRLQNLVREFQKEQKASQWGVHLREIPTQESGWLDARRGTKEQAMDWASSAGRVYEARADVPKG